MQSWCKPIDVCWIFISGDFILSFQKIITLSINNTRIKVKDNIYIYIYIPHRSVALSGYSGFLRQKNWPPRYNWNIVENGVKPNSLEYKILHHLPSRFLGPHIRPKRHIDLRSVPNLFATLSMSILTKIWQLKNLILTLV